MADEKPIAGGMGLTGLFALVGNASAMTLVGVLLFWSQYRMDQNHTDSIEAMTKAHDAQLQTMRELYEAERERNKQYWAYQRELTLSNRKILETVATDVKAAMK